MLFVCGVGILLADQWSKQTIQIHTAGRGWGALVRFRFMAHRERFYERTGARAVLVLTWVLALVCATVLYRRGVWFQGGTSLTGLGLAFGGAASNLVDILRRGYVIDFIDLGWWPVFNLADVAIVAGLSVAFLG